jgi:hypothetical protein
MVKVMVLKVWHQGHLQWHELLPEFYENLPFGTEVGIKWDDTDGQTGKRMDRRRDSMVIS